MRAIKEESKLLSSGSSAHNYGDPCSLSGDLKPVTLTWENISVFVSTGQSQGCSFRRSKTATVKDEEEGVEKCILNDGECQRRFVRSTLWGNFQHFFYIFGVGNQN